MSLRPRSNGNHNYVSLVREQYSEINDEWDSSYERESVIANYQNSIVLDWSLSRTLRHVQF